MKLTETGKRGLHSVLGFKCSRCGRTTLLPTTTCPNKNSSHIKHQAVYINRRATFTTLETGIGREALTTICEIIELPTPAFPQAHSDHENVILEAQLEIVDQHVKEARAEARAHSLTNSGLDPSDQTLVADIPVSFDGTWSKRVLYSKQRDRFHNISRHRQSAGLLCPIKVLPSVCSE